MSTALQPVITKAGLAAILRADNTGIAAQITHIALGTSSYTPSADQKTLLAQTAKYEISGGERLSSTLLHLTAVADGDRAFWVREIGFFLSDGTLLAVWSHPTEALAYKSASTDLLLAYDLSLTALPANSVTIISNEAGLSLSLAGPLAAQANALLAEQLRGLQRQDRLDDHSQQHTITDSRLTALTERMRLAESRQVSDKSDLGEQSAALAAGLVTEYLRGLQQQDALEAQARLQQINTLKVDQSLERVRLLEQRQATTDHEGLVTAVAANATAVISLQLQVTKMTYGA